MDIKKIAVDSTVLLRDADGVADSRILAGFRSMIESEAVTRARNAGYAVPERYCRVGEFGLDIIGETATEANMRPDGRYLPEGVEKLIQGEVSALLSLDVNGAPRRSTASTMLINMKPTYGTVSRYGAVPVVSSADTVSVTAKTAEDCQALLSVLCGRDEKDPTTVSDRLCPMKNARPATGGLRVTVCNDAVKTADPAVMERYNGTVRQLTAIGAEIAHLPTEAQTLLKVAHAAWNTVLCAEARGNLSRYDGIRYGKRATEYKDLGEAYVKSRSEGFGELVKAVMLYGSYVLSPDCESGGFAKAAEARRWVNAEVNALFENTDVLLLPAGSVPFYTSENIKSQGITALNENFYTALPSLCGLPTLTVDGVQFIGKPFSDNVLLTALSRLAERLRPGGQAPARDYVSRRLRAAANYGSRRGQTPTSS